MLRPAHPVGQQTLSRWESGLCRVPNEVMARAQELLRRGLVATPQLGGGGGEEGRAEEKEGGVGEDGKYLASEYPYQEPMLGDSFQVSSRDIPEAVLYDPLKHSGDPDEDARLGVLEWRGEAQLAPKVTPSQLAAYLATVRALCTSCLAIEFSEETALSTLHTLEEDVEAALESLRAAVAWHAGDQATVLSAPPAVLMRTALWAGLRAEPGCTVHWKPGEVAALDASMLAYDRDLIAIHENTFAERPLKEVVWHYYRHGAFRRHQVAAQALGIPEPTVDSVVAGPLPLQ
ncbi:hypothetical protein T492DRAFT_1066417 [Pavlovales sp. CCMP2436]|nr:hypothetical protein T492DRAFT_1066417 [Pavlovales sp. CCMP2436]